MSETEETEISLLIEGHVFKAKKNVLCDYSDYFRAMFNGNYVESEQNEIAVNVVDANSMNIIMQYMDIGLIDLSEYSLCTIGKLASAASFLQIVELIKQIEYVLDLRTSTSNWMEILTIAENCNFTKLQGLCSAFGLLSFPKIETSCIPSIEKLYWYLSHPYLNAENELQVFKFGLDCITVTDGDVILIILGCLDVTRLTCSDIKEMRKRLRTVSYVNSLAARIVDCLYELVVTSCELSVSAVSSQRTKLCEKFTERVYNEVLTLVKESKSRKLTYTPVIPIRTNKCTKNVSVPQYVYTFTEERGFEQWLEVAAENIWGWSITSWGETKLVVVGGEKGRGTGLFVNDVKVYDTLRNEWIQHGVNLPPRRHGGVAVVEDSLFIIGGVGAFRIVLNTAIIYDLKQRSFRKIAKFPDAIQNPAVCVHENKVYVAGHRKIYRYDDLRDTDRWVQVLYTHIRLFCMLSYKGYIYCTQDYYPGLYRFKPGVCKTLETVTGFTEPLVAICNLKDRLISFNKTLRICVIHNTPDLIVEEFRSDQTEEMPKILWKQEIDKDVVKAAGSCALIMSVPPLQPETSLYSQRYLKKYTDSIGI